MTNEYQLSAQQLTQQIVGEYLTLFQNNTRSKCTIAMQNIKLCSFANLLKRRANGRYIVG